MRNRAVKVIREAKGRFELKLARQVQVNPKRYFRYVQSRTKTRNEIRRLLIVEGRQVDSNVGIAEAFRLAFASVYHPDPGVPIPYLGTASPAVMPEVLIEPVNVRSEALKSDDHKTEG